MSEEVSVLKKELGEDVKYFCGVMYCGECKREAKVRKEVYIKRLIVGKKKGLSEEEVNRQYLCRRCRNGNTVKKEAFYEMLKEKD